jgi:RecA/RadA recombinase
MKDVIDRHLQNTTQELCQHRHIKNECGTTQIGNNQCQDKPGVLQ